MGLAGDGVALEDGSRRCLRTWETDDAAMNGAGTRRIVRAAERSIRGADWSRQAGIAAATRGRSCGSGAPATNSLISSSNAATMRSAEPCGVGGLFCIAAVLCANANASHYNRNAGESQAPKSAKIAERLPDGRTQRPASAPAAGRGVR